MTTNFVSLLTLANFPKEKIDTLMKDIKYVTDEEKFRLSNLAWYFIANKYFLQVSLHERKLLEEIKTGVRKYNASDFEEIKAKFLHELVEKLENVGTQTSLEEVRKQLEIHKTKPLTVDPSKAPVKQ